MFIYCKMCGKKLIFQRPDGTLVFRFGKSHVEQPIVDMEIYGEVRLSCLRRGCDHITVVSTNRVLAKQEQQREGE